jgi:nicotinate-nucleotide pyrophosphorylase (carboxylating)
VTAPEMRLPEDVEAVIGLAIEEDVGAGDWTTLWTVAPTRHATARIVAKAAGVVAGTEVARSVFHRVDPMLGVEIVVGDGGAVRPGDEVIRLDGAARAILTAERTALNFLQRLSGIATVTREYVDAVAGTGARILDTRKTTPGLRTLEKAAVAAGGGSNHRIGLHDMVLIKENHIRAAGGITAALDAVARQNAAGLPVEIEVTSQDELREALAAGARRVLLDNMSIEELRAAVALAKEFAPGTETEASGGVTLHRLREIAETGVTYISSGALTHSAPALDLSLLITESE